MSNQYDDYQTFFAHAPSIREVRENDPESLRNYLARAMKDSEFIRSNGNAATELKRANPELYRSIIGKTQSN